MRRSCERRDDQRRPAGEVALRAEGERRDPAVAVAAEARLADDRRDVAGEARVPRFRDPSAGSATAAPSVAAANATQSGTLRASTRIVGGSLWASRLHARRLSYVPQTSRSAPQISPTVQRAASASRRAGSRFSSVSATRRTSASAASPSRRRARAERLDALELRALDLGVEAVQLDALGLVGR